MGKNVAVSRRAISRRLVKKREASFLTASIFARGASYIPHCVRSYIAVKKAVLFYTAVKRDKKEKTGSSYFCVFGKARKNIYKNPYGPILTFC